MNKKVLPLIGIIDFIFQSKTKISILVFYDISIGSTEIKCIKLNTKTQNIFCRLNENLTLTGATRKQKEKKFFSFKVYTKVECYF